MFLALAIETASSHAIVLSVATTTTPIGSARTIDWSKEGDTCVALLRDLIRIPTVNRGTRDEGDGNERPAAERVAEHLRAAGVEPKLYEKTKGRTNVVARVKGD